MTPGRMWNARRLLVKVHALLNGYQLLDLGYSSNAVGGLDDGEIDRYISEYKLAPDPINEEQEPPQEVVRDPIVTFASQLDYVKNVDSGKTRCPCCDSDDLSLGTLDAEGNIAVSECSCGGCGFEWWEIWECTGYNYNQDTGDRTDVK